MRPTIEIKPCHFCINRLQSEEECSYCDDFDRFKHEFQEEYITDVYQLEDWEKEDYFSAREDLKVKNILDYALRHKMSVFGVRCRYRTISYRDKEKTKAVLVFIGHQKKDYELSIDYTHGQVLNGVFSVSLTETIMKYLKG